MLHLDLFSGIGGFALACQWAGIETIGFVEIDKYCQKVLKKNFPDVPIVEDIRDVEKIKEIVADTKSFYEQRGKEKKGNKEIGDESRRPYVERFKPARNTDNQEPPTILITAGFPCQPFSVASKRQGEGDDRYLWPETLAVIKAIKPEWALLENVTGIINLALDTVLSDLEGANYSTETLVIPACAVNAPHRRDRIWIVANATGFRFKGNGKLATRERMGQAEEGTYPAESGHNVPLATSTRQADNQRCGIYEGMDWQTRTDGDNRQNGEHENWFIEPELGRVAYGIPNRVDRLKCLGNAIVPQVAYEIIKVIKKSEVTQ